jgi:transposase
MEKRGRPIAKLKLTPGEKQSLQQTVRRRGAGHLEVLRAKVILWAAEGLSNTEIVRRTQPVLSVRPGRVERPTHDYYRHGTLALFAALNVATGQIISATKPKHRTKEFLNFLRQIEREVPADLDLHIILDNYATHKTEAVEDWLAKSPRWKLHFTPTHSSWLNQVERFFAKITNERIRRGVFQSVADLHRAIKEYIAAHNKNPRPFRWTASAELIVGKVKHICNELR